MSEDVITLIRRSGKGDMEAHRTLADMAIAAGFDAVGKGDDAYLNYYEASIYSRLAATSGKLADLARLMSVLAICANLAERNGETDDAETYHAEGIGLAELIADSNEGEASECAAQMIANGAGECSPAVLEMAKEFKTLWSAE